MPRSFRCAWQVLLKDTVSQTVAKGGYKIYEYLVDRHCRVRSVTQDDGKVELCVKALRQTQANSAWGWISETMPQQNTFIRQKNNFPYPSCVRLLSESVVAVGNRNTILPVQVYTTTCGWRELCARPGAILEFLVISRQLLQLEIALRSSEKQMFHTVGNT